MIWVLLAIVVFVAVLVLVYRWAAPRAPRGAYRGQGRFGGAGIVEKMSEDDLDTRR